MKKNKKCTLIQGTINLPLKTGARARIKYSGETISTSPVEKILEVSAERVVIETQNTVYYVSPDYSNETLKTNSLSMIVLV